MSTLQHQLQQLGACEDALSWVSAYDDPVTAWFNCDRSDWLLWMGSKVNLQIELVILVACACARLALLYTHNEDVIFTIEAVEQWAIDHLRPGFKERNKATTDAQVALFANAARASMYAAAAAEDVAAFHTARAAFHVARAALCASIAFMLVAADNENVMAADHAVAAALYAVTATQTPRQHANLVREKIDETTITDYWRAKSRQMELQEAAT